MSDKTVTVTLTERDWVILSGAVIDASVAPDGRGWPSEELDAAMGRLHEAIGDDLFYGKQ